MNIYFENRDIDSYNNDVEYRWYISSNYGDYRLIMRFCGAVRDDNTINFGMTSFCNISLNECNDNEDGFIEIIKKRIEKESNIEIESFQDVSMISAPITRTSIHYTDESDIDNSIEIAKSFLKNAAVVLGDGEKIDIDELIDNYVVEDNEPQEWIKPILTNLKSIKNLITNDTSRFLDSCMESSIPKISIKYHGVQADIPMDLADTNQYMEGFIDELIEFMKEV